MVAKTTDDADKLWILVVGNPVDGYQYYGPFGLHENALVFAEQYCQLNTWWIAELEDTRPLVRQNSPF